MAISSVNPVRFKPSTQQKALSSPQSNGVVQVDYEQMFRLIDGILPFEACLYHQVLPLTLEGTRLKLGMVNPGDTAALDYVRRILAYMNCSLVPQPISAEDHQAALTAYLNHTGQLQRAKLAQPVPDASFQKKTGASDRQNRATLIVDSPEELDELDGEPTHIQPPITSTQSLAAEIPPQHQVKTEKPQPEAIQQPPIAPAAKLNLPVLEVQAKYLSSPMDVLATLPPKQLLQELLGRILAGGIGRLYFERHPERGRILWSQNGVLQSVLEGLEPNVFQGVINELKRLTYMSMISVEKPKQVEIERLYQRNRLLLRLRVMPGTHGEEATLQVLRGAALKFYQQQQLENLSRDALTIAQQLQRKVNEIRDRTQGNPALATNQIEALPALDQLLKSLDRQMEALRLLQADREQDDEI